MQFVLRFLVRQDFPLLRVGILDPAREGALLESRGGELQEFSGVPSVSIHVGSAILTGAA